MNFAIIGGDLRSGYLARRLLRDGHSVSCYGLELTDVPPRCHGADLAHVLRDAQCVVLPTPTADGSLLRTPYGTAPVTLEALADALPRHVPVFGGGIAPRLRELCAQRGIFLQDLLGSEAAAVRNAALTAQCVPPLLTEHTRRTPAGQQVLILGAGRIGKLTGLLLRDMGAQVTVSARRREDRAWCAALGLIPSSTEDLETVLPHCDWVINTVPAPILDQRLLSLLPRGAVLTELASAPGGFDELRARAMGITVIMGRGLPGRYAPQTAADSMAETIYEELEM